VSARRERLHSELSYKRLEQDRFVWPSADAVPALTVEQLHWLLEGIDIARVQRHPKRQYQRVA
jgi:transposase